ncbi:tyrosine-type recombinase/integrase [Halodesulfovibrio sp.]|uniref:tyrosine-type recombinase/integrase n=1 Tax=Halodesulfovibrio sp. TaxID=1912772 RepID=UPI0025DFD592|nr:tyrosine-type recombinase/integrase [Halodesulfovibrio sp.]MCT4627729.1 site-specific integrase [Halodesulfovibrio sp.]
MSKRHSSDFPGIYYRIHLTRKVAPGSRKKDMYLILRLRIDGKVTDHGLGWLSEGMTFEEALRIQKILKRNIKLGEGAQSVKELREAKKQKRKEDKRKLLDSIAEEQATRVTVKKAAKDFLQWAVDSDKKNSTITSYNSVMLNHIIPHLGDLQLNSLTHKRILAFRKELEKKQLLRKNLNSRRSNKLSKSTSNEILGRLRSLLNYCIVTPASDEYPHRKMFEGENPLVPNRYSGASLFFKVEKGNRRILRDDDLDAIFELAALSGQLYVDLIEVALNTGMRVSELVVIQKADLRDIERQILYIPKGKTGPRTIRFPARLLHIFERRLQQNSRYIFPGKGRTGHITTTSASGKFTNICRKLKINEHVEDNQTRATFHTLRSMCAVNMLVAKYDIAIVSSQLGHSDVRITMDYYLPIAEMLLEGSTGGYSKYNGFLSFDEH